MDKPVCPLSELEILSQIFDEYQPINNGQTPKIALTHDIVKRALEMAEIPNDESGQSRVAQLEKSLKEAQDQLANEKKLRLKHYMRLARAKSNWKTQNYKLQKEVQHLSGLLNLHRDEKQSAECDMNLYEHMIGERDRKLTENEKMLKENEEKINHLQNEYRLLLDNFIEIKVELNRLTHNFSNTQ